MHYARFRAHGDPEWMAEPKVCGVDGCGRPHEAFGLCSMHYRRRRVHGDPLATAKLFWPDNLLKRLLPQPNGCIWHDSVPNTEGYAVITKGGRQLKAHRAMYELKVGPIPDGYVVDHTCHNTDPTCTSWVHCLHKRCVNPEHLEAKPNRANLMDSPHSTGSRNAAKTHCPHGHEYTEENTIVNSKGSRVCRICRKINWTKRNAKRSALRRQARESQ